MCYVIRFIYCLAEYRLSCLFQVFHFLYTYAVTFNIGSFTLDEFAQAFSDKVSARIWSSVIWLRLIICFTWLVQFARSCYPFMLVFFRLLFAYSVFVRTWLQESMLLGKIHLAILKQLLSDLEVELSRGFLPRASKNGNFVELLHSVSFKES